MCNTKLLQDWINFATEDEKGAANVCGSVGAPLCMAATGVRNEHDEGNYERTKPILWQHLLFQTFVA